MKRTIAIVILAVLLLSLFAACGKGGGKDNGESKYIGLYKFSKMSSDDMTMTVQEYAELFEMDVEEAAKFITVELKSGGKGVFASDGDNTDITWKVDGEKLILTGTNDDGTEDSFEGTIKDGVITLNFDGEILELTK